MRFGMLSICDNDPAQRSNQQFYAELLDQIVLAEELGYEDFWIAEHHYSNYGVVPSPAVLLSAAAARTSRIGLGCGVSILPFHDPVQVAEDYAMVDLISNGRLVFGAGRGFLIHEYEGFRIRDQDESRERFDESLDIIRKAWTGERFSYHGTYYRVDDVRINVLPVKPPPMYMAALSPSSFERAAALGIPVAGVSATLRTMDRIEERIGTFKRLWAEAGRDASTVDVPMTWYTFVVPSKDRAYSDGGRQLIDYYRSIGSVFDPRRINDPEGRKVYEELYAWNNTVTWEHIENNTDVAMIGDPETVIAKLEKARAAGVEKVHCFMNFGNRPHAQVAASMELFAKEVMPALR
ncbi:LLM class flavin-dependent oxidoreductase [Pseudonocardia acidicola]|uniref:LLM class flavin-dependent oxidoreductase n=1 Tax=Pseudonocardia acidicola TaxID=2724939 RepID=A0ABX1SBM5_9PSEU|nr:LLM class flavin-dependent oxidoreductase [Pseudonocardia acidicola]NMH97947.1 LLM class flavin-dependent oxidoreductase [Pseudonocardia acidicola]